MSRWTSIALGGIQTSLLWGFAGSTVGFVLARTNRFDGDLPFPILFFVLGFLAGLIYSVLSGILRRANASLARHAALGAVSGLLLTGTIVLGAIIRADNDPWDELLLFGPGLITGSIVCALGSQLFAERRKHQTA